jgi:hypothetical protein
MNKRKDEYAELEAWYKWEWAQRSVQGGGRVGVGGGRYRQDVEGGQRELKHMRSCGGARVGEASSLKLS